MKTLQVLISAEDIDQANAILDALLAKKLILGGPILSGPAKFWWKGAIVEMSYCYILTYTLDTLKDVVIAEVERVSQEEIAMLSFAEFEGNEGLTKLVVDTLST